MKPTHLLKMSYLFIFLLVSSTTILTSGCVPKPAIMSELDFCPALQIETEISRREQEIKTDTDSSSKARSLLSLTLLYSHHKNPNPDYPKALKKLEEFTLLDLKYGEADSVQYLMALLQKIVKTENKYVKSRTSIKKLNNRIKKLEQKTEKLRKEYETLVRENQEKKEKLEKLMHLDIQLEKRRQDIK